MTMFNIHKKEIMWGGRKLTIETGRMARQADASVVVTYGDTVVLGTVCVSRQAPTTFADFIPLTVNYIEKTYAAGLIPGSFFRREGRPSENEVLISRLIDRPIRPLFVKGFRNETQVTCMLMSYDKKALPDVVAIIAASAALTLSGLPFLGPVAAAKVGYINGEYVLNPSYSQVKESALELTVAGTKEGVLMVESEAKELSEDVMLGAVSFGHEQFQPVIQMITALAEECAKEPWPVPQKPEAYDRVRQTLSEQFSAELAEAYKIHEKLARLDAVNAIREKAKEAFAQDEAGAPLVDSIFHELEAAVVRQTVLQTGIRIDGRNTKTVRPIEAAVDILPKVHGSALFTRGETQAMVVATLGTGEDEQLVDDLAGEWRQTFLLHYNFPPYSVGETGRMGSPGRREIGHGKLAWRAIHPMLPTHDDFPYTLRVVSEIMESNGSSSMATVCGSSLALMDAGVPLKKPVAGIAMGLIKEGYNFSVLTDIMGDEDHLGDMDFKVAGTKDGITALQMDIKITSITREIMSVALAQAKEGRMHILGKMAEAITEPRGEISKNAPRITTIRIDKDKIREVIGSGGKIIREIVEKTGARVDISEDGVINIAAVDGDAGKAAVEWIQSIVCEPEIGKVYNGKVVKLLEFGAFVNFLGSRDGMVHVSEVVNCPGRLERIDSVLSEGQEVKVKVMSIDKRGKVKLSMKRVDQTTGEDLEKDGRKFETPVDDDLAEQNVAERETEEDDDDKIVY